MLVDVAGATCTAPACAVAVNVDVVVVAGADRMVPALRSIASMTFSINSGRKAVRAARTISTTCVAMSVMWNGEQEEEEEEQGGGERNQAFGACCNCVECICCVCNCCDCTCCD